jgi:hypothetical protein
MSERRKPLVFFFATNDCPRAKWKRRTRVSKANSESGDEQPDGTLGVVVGSIGHPTFDVAYFVEWDTAQGTPELVAEKKLTAAPSRQQSAPKTSKTAKNETGAA